MRKLQDRNIPFEKLQALVEQYAASKRSLSTRRNYRADWNMLRTWCESTGQPFPPPGDTIAAYLVYLLECGHKVACVERRLSSFRYQHRRLGLPVPDLKLATAVMAGARRELRQKPRQAKALSADQLRSMCRALGNRPIDVRDRTILVLGFASGLRGSELAGLELADVAFAPAGLVVTIRRSKTDQEGKGRSIGVFRSHGGICPVKTLRAWLQLRGNDPGPLLYACSRTRLRAGRGISWDIVHAAVRRAAGLIGLDPLRYGSHSLRASFITTAAVRGAAPLAIMQVTGHKSVEMVARYIRADVFRFKQARAL